LTAGAVIDPGSDGRARRGGTVGHGEGRNCVEHSPWFHPCDACARWAMAVACGVGATCPQAHSGWINLISRFRAKAPVM
jgi:hypothetical protein